MVSQAEKNRMAEENRKREVEAAELKAKQEAEQERKRLAEIQAAADNKAREEREKLEDQEDAKRRVEESKRGGNPPCLFCKAKNSYVNNTRTDDTGVRRSRVCRTCGKSFSTYQPLEKVQV